ncbi:MAG: ATP-binding cassette domain-containing protein [Erysipelotrichaceae bacterium]|nr:ATP-binding cassette domain-containing protein [Erysipelotrichaceae bacterium]MDY5251134.1 ATP-binding cassette domain-containing protein [Erysipelotrichaceae bacterium]
MIVMENVSKSFGQQLIFDKINLRIDKCGFYAFVGPSGCGKSTLLSMIAKSEDVTNGTIKVDGNVATIYQDYQLFAELTVEDNVTLLNDMVDFQQISAELALSDLINQYPAELSGGQQQRVGIARAIALDPDIILCDEPTESLDRENKTLVMEYLKKLSAHKIVIIVSHDLNLINEYVDVIYKICDHQLVKQILHEQKKCLKTKHQQLKLDVKEIIKKLQYKKELKIGILLNLLGLLLVLMYVLSAKLFYVSNSSNVLNIDKLYVNIYDKYSDFEIAHASNLVKIVPFEEAIINDKNYIVNIYPAVKNDDFEFKYPVGDEVVVNQNLEDDVAIGEGIDLVYESVDGTLGIVTFYVVDIIDEDTTQNNIYYNLDTIDQVFVTENDKLEINYSDYLAQMSNQAQLDIVYDDIEQIYADNQALKDVSIYHPTYELRQKMKNNMLIFKVMAYSFQLLYFLGLIMFMVIYNHKSNQKALKNYALLLSFGGDRKAIQHDHFYYKTTSFLVGYSLFVILGFSLFVGFGTYLSKLDQLVLLIIGVLLLGGYLASAMISSKQLSNFRINRIIKNEN